MKNFYHNKDRLTALLEKDDLEVVAVLISADKLEINDLTKSQVIKKVFQLPFGNIKEFNELLKIAKEKAEALDTKSRNKLEKNVEKMIMSYKMVYYEELLEKNKRALLKKEKEAEKKPAKDTVKKATTKKAPAKKAPAKRTAAKNTSAKKTVAKKAPAEKTAAKKTSAKKTVAKKAPAKKAAAKKAPAKKSAAKKAPAKKAATKKAAPKKKSAKK